MIAILVARPSMTELPHQRLVTVEWVEPNSWRTWYPFVHETTHTFQTASFSVQGAAGVEILVDEDGRRKKFRPNMAIAARAPTPSPLEGFLIDTTNGRGMKPGAPGEGYHLLLGTVIFAQRKGNKYVSLLPSTIQTLTALLTTSPDGNV